MKNFWTENQILRLRELWNTTKVPASKIGEELGRTRNAIIGCASRDPECLPRVAKTHKTNVQENVEEKRPYAPRRRKWEKVPEPDNMRRVDFRDTGKHNCMFILDDAYTCCGNDAVKSGAWCDYHFNVVHEKGSRL